MKHFKAVLLTVGGQVVDERGQEGDEHTGDDDVDDVEEGLPLDDQVEGDVLVLVALHGDVLVGVPPGRTVHHLPLAVLWLVDWWRSRRHFIIQGSHTFFSQ